MMQDNKIIIFPKWKSMLKEESLRALEEKKYSDALKNFNQLIEFQVTSHEVLVGKLICLLELGHYDAAEELCLESMQGANQNHYFHYIHIYLTILFQTNRYEELMVYVEEEVSSRDISPTSRIQIKELYELSKEMKKSQKEEQILRDIKSFWKAIENQDAPTQWYLIEELRKAAAPPSEAFVLLLQKESIHPVVKTAIIHWFKEITIQEEVTISKFKETIQLIPAQIPDIHKSIFMEELLADFYEIEDKDPTLYAIIEQMAYRYAYVKYPFVINLVHHPLLAKSFLALATQYLPVKDYQAEVEDSQLPYISDIKETELLYLSIIEQ